MSDYATGTIVPFTDSDNRYPARLYSDGRITASIGWTDYRTGEPVFSDTRELGSARIRASWVPDTVPNADDMDPARYGGVTVERALTPAPYVRIEFPDMYHAAQWVDQWDIAEDVAIDHPYIGRTWFDRPVTITYRPTAVRKGE